MEICYICKEIIKFESFLPCNCRFCFACITKHINSRNYCPICFATPFHNTDIHCLKEENKINEDKLILKMENGTFSTNKLPILKPFFYKKMTIEKLKKECKRFNLKIGTRNEMVERLKEFYLLYTIEKRTRNSLSVYGLACVVHKNEKNKSIHFDIDHLIEHNIEKICEIKRNFLNK